MRTALRFLLMSAGLLTSFTALAHPGHDIAIKMQKESFVPAKIEVAAGTKVTWTNTDEVPHSVTADDGRFDSGPVMPGKSFEWTPDKAGTLNYHCIFHPSMTAVLTVDAPAAKNGHTP